MFKRLSECTNNNTQDSQNWLGAKCLFHILKTHQGKWFNAQVTDNKRQRESQVCYSFVPLTTSIQKSLTI